MSPGLLFVSPWLQSGGIERQIQMKGPWFVRRGYRVEIVSWFIAEQLSGRPNPVLETFKEHGIRVRRLRTVGGRLELIQRALQLAVIARRGRCDVIVGHELAGNLVAIAAKLLLGKRMRVIAEVHNASGIYAETGIGRVTVALARALYRRADGVIAVSETVAKDAAEFFRLDRTRIATIYNPFRLEEIRRLATQPLPPFDPAGSYVVSCGRLVRMKGFTDLIRAFSLVRQRGPLKLVILGDGPDRDELRQCAEELGVAGDLRLPGFVANPFPYFARARVFVLSSRFGESFSRVLVEAMACGVPVIASRCEWGPEEVLAGGKYGLLYEVGDVQGLAARMIQAIEEPEETRRRVAAAQSRVAEWSEDKVLPQIERYYFGWSPGDRDLRQCPSANGLVHSPGTSGQLR